MAQKKHKSKFRHIFGEPAKPEGCYTDLKKPMTSGNGRYVAVNDKFWAVGKSGGGAPVYVNKIDNVGRMKPNMGVVAVHKGKISDMAWHPFNNTLLATCADDCSVALSQIPEDGITPGQNITEASVVMKGHSKKVSIVRWNPSASSVLASCSSQDKSVRLWNAETGENIITFDAFKDLVYTMEWNKDGSLLAATSKDYNMRVFDPRNPEGETAQTINHTDAAKFSSPFWVNNFGWVGTTCFSKTAKRQLKLWDLRKSDAPIYSNNLDSASSILMPHFDDSSNVLYTFGKGGSSVYYTEIVNDNRKIYDLGLYRAKDSQTGGGWAPKRALDVWKCEVQRFFRLTGKGSLIPVSFIVPRKVGNDVFQEDIYPDARAPVAALSIDEWVGGENKDPVMMSLNPENRQEFKQAAFEAKKSYAELEAENKALKQQLAALKKEYGVVDEEEKEADEE